MDFQNMNSTQQANALKAQYAGAGLGSASTKGLAMPNAVESASAGIISRLNQIRGNFSETRASLDAVADKIVGPAPTLMTGNGTGQIVKGERVSPSCFLDALQQVLDDIEGIGTDIQEHLNRLHRPF